MIYPMTHTRIEMDTMSATIRSERHLERIADALEGRSEEILKWIEARLQEFDINDLRHKEEKSSSEEALLDIAEKLNL